ERDAGVAANQRRASIIVKPALRALEAVEAAVRAVRVRHRRALRAADHGEVSADDHRAVERSGIRTCHTIGRADNRRPASRGGRTHQAVAFRRKAVNTESTRSGTPAGITGVVQRIEGDGTAIDVCRNFRPHGIASAATYAVHAWRVLRVRDAVDSRRLT